MATRRDFLRTGAAICCTAGTMTVILQACGNYKSVVAVAENDKLTVKKADFEEGKNFLVVKAPSAELKANIYLSRLPGDNFTALLMLCTHKECDVKPTGKTLTCFCHGSEFSSTGKVLKEPATRDLQSYQVTADTTNIYIHLK